MREVIRAGAGVMGGGRRWKDGAEWNYLFAKAGPKRGLPAARR